jgi:hypothetical protein
MGAPALRPRHEENCHILAINRKGAPRALVSLRQGIALPYRLNLLHAHRIIGSKSQHDRFYLFS